VTEASKSGVRFRDVETGEEHEAKARVVVNAAGPFSDAVRRMADSSASPIVVPSQGIHIVLDRAFLPAENALMVPRTPDGRVMFAIPWLGHTLIGTTDTPVRNARLEPLPLDSEIEFLLEVSGHYLAKRPARADIRSVFAGIRPLVGSEGKSTAAVSRDHTIRVEPSGLLTIVGGKWTTYRRMAEDCVDRAAAIAGLPQRPCVTRDLPIHRWTDDQPPVVRAVRDEMARTVEDVLARRTRALFLDARSAILQAPAVAHVLGRELGRDSAWETAQIEAFEELAQGYLPG